MVKHKFSQGSLLYAARYMYKQKYNKSNTLFSGYDKIKG